MTLYIKKIVEMKDWIDKKNLHIKKDNLFKF